jgi:hypothetical protein
LVRESATAMKLRLEGRCSSFGGPNDLGVGPSEGLALVDPSNFGLFRDYFLPEQPSGTTGLARRLNPAAFYIACRWDYSITPKAYLVGSMATVSDRNMSRRALARPVDWGPAIRTGRVADLSPGLLQFLGLQTDSDVIVTLD